MLTPGEFVVNRRAASDPRNAALLEQMNGGPGGPSMGMGMPSQGLSREALVELLQVLLGGGGGDQMCPQCAGQGCGMCMGGRVPGYKHGGWVLPVAALAAITAPLWAPAAAGALGLGAASGAGAGAAGAGAAGAGATTIGSGTAAGLSVGPTAAVPGLAHTANTGLLGTLTRTVQMHPGLVKGGEMAYGAAQDQRDQREQGMMQREQDSNDAVQRYLMARQQSESVPGYAIGGFVGPTWAKPGGMSPFIAVRPGGGGGGPLAPPPHTGAPPVAGPGNLPMNWANPGAMAGMAEAGARDANDYASGVYRQAQLAGADPGAQAAYRLRALAGAGRGSAEALSKYRTDNAAAEQQRLFDLYKQSKDFEYQAALKRIH
jgi:hypothetical protein